MNEKINPVFITKLQNLIRNSIKTTTTVSDFALLHDWLANSAFFGEISHDEYNGLLTALYAIYDAMDAAGFIEKE